MKIAIFRALYVGDLLCVIPAVRAIKRAWPAASVTLIGLPWQKSFIERFHHYFDGYIAFPGWPGLPEQPLDPAGINAFLAHVQAQQFDLVLQMQGDGVLTNPMCMLFGSKLVAGLRKEGSYNPYEGLFPVFNEQEHEITRFLKITAALGLPSDDTALEFPVSEAECRSYEQLRGQLRLPAGDRYVCVHAGARDPRRRWVPGNFAHVADALAAKGYTIVLTGSGDEKALTATVAKHMQHPAIDLVNIAGHTGLGELALLIRDAALLVSNDTGVSHIAAAFKTPSVIIFSRHSDPRRWAPLDKTLHCAVTADQADDVDYVKDCALMQLQVKNSMRNRVKAMSDESISPYSHM
jgi:ADP-heptose:LPS heptosyltransferase